MARTQVGLERGHLEMRVPRRRVLFHCFLGNAHLEGVVQLLRVVVFLFGSDSRLVSHTGPLRNRVSSICFCLPLVIAPGWYSFPTWPSAAELMNYAECISSFSHVLSGPLVCI
jgi:hypothetical protein